MQLETINTENSTVNTEAQPAEQSFRCNGRSLFGCNDSVEKIRTSILAFFHGLNDKGLLYTDVSFEAKLKQSHTPLYSKGDNITRLIGARFLKSIIDKNNYQYVKVPEKYIVLNTQNANYYFSPLSNGLMQSTERMCDPIQLKVYHQHISRSEREIRDEELIELIMLLSEAGFSDKHGGNFIIAEDGIYVVDTEENSFDAVPKLPNIDKMAKLFIENQKDPSKVRASLEQKLPQLHQRITLAQRQYQEWKASEDKRTPQSKPYLFSSQELFPKA